MINVSNADPWEGEVPTSSIDLSPSNRYGERNGRNSVFQGLWNRIDLNYMRPLFGGVREGSPDRMRLGFQGNTKALNDIATECSHERQSMLFSDGDVFER